MNKIVVIAPSDKPVELIEILCFFHALKKYLEVHEFSLIVEQKKESYTDFLLQDIRLIQRKPEDFGLLESIKYAHKLNDLFNITHVFNLDTTLGSISFAKSLKAKFYFGKKSKLTNLLYTKEFESNVLEGVLKYYARDEFEKGVFYNKEMNSSSENFFREKTSEPFLFLALGAEPVSSFEIIHRTLRELKDKRVIFWCEESGEYLNSLKSISPSFTDASEVSEDLLYRYVASSFGVITNIRAMARISNYFLIENFLFPQEYALEPNSLMVNKTVSILNSKDSFLLDYSNGQREEKSNVDEVISIILSLLND